LMRFASGRVSKEFMFVIISMDILFPK
jgi:hypothetical protein